MNPLYNCLRGGANSCGRALQLAYHKKAKRCILIGVDMEGKGYFDGTSNEHKRSMNPDGLWTQKYMLQRLVDGLRADGLEIVSMTKTRLDVEVV